MQDCTANHDYLSVKVTARSGGVMSMQGQCLTPEESRCFHQQEQGGKGVWVEGVGRGVAP